MIHLRLSRSSRAKSVSFQMLSDAKSNNNWLSWLIRKCKEANNSETSCELKFSKDAWDKV